MRILLADDHPFALYALRALLARSGDLEIVGTANNAGALLSALATHACDIVVSDYAMPDGGGDGWPLFAAILHRFPGVKVVACTAYANAALVASLTVLGVHAIVSKRDPPEAIETAVRAAAAGSHHLSAACLAALRTADASSPAGRLAKLSRRELEVFGLLVSGLSVSESARLTRRSEKTISAQKHAAMQKLDAGNNWQLYRYAQQHDLLLYPEFA